jgi:limonene-1,2-epoxide hydrolase
MKRAIGVSRRSFTAGGISALAALGFSRFAGAQAPQMIGRTVGPDVEKANIAAVNEFCTAFERKDLTKAVALLADNCVYRPMQTRPPIAGKDKVTETLKGFLDRVVAFKVLRTASLGPIVLNERDDVFAANGAQAARTFRATGIFFLENGKIVEWIDVVLQ